MRKGFWRHFKNFKNRMIFGHYGRNVLIQSGVRIVRPQFISIGDNVTIGKDSDIYVHPADRNSKKIIIELGNHVVLARNNIVGARYGIVLEDYVGLSAYTMVGDFSRHYDDIEVPFQLQDVTEEGPIRIERWTWIGAHAFILPNVTIGRNSVVGANSVVNRDIPAYSVAVGVPARVVKRYDFDLKQWVRVDE
jgi:acetyltransferase-like isoleucine patch superfamily enzyme